MNPMQAFANRTARLASEATTPVYSTTTPTREEFLASYDHMVMVELDGIYGRSRSIMPESETDAYLDALLGSSDYEMSDYCHACACKCGEPSFMV